MTVTANEAKTQLSSLIERALAGEDIVIAKHDRPLVKLTAVDEIKQKSKVRYGGLKDLVIVMGDNFNEEINDFDDYGPTSANKVAEDPKPYTT